MADIYFKKVKTVMGEYLSLKAVTNIQPGERSRLSIELAEYQAMAGDIGEPEKAENGMAEIRASLKQAGHTIHVQESVAVAVVSALLEAYNPYDIDDPLDLPELPGGFIATSPEGERFEVTLSEMANLPAYKWMKFWWNDHEKKLLPFYMGSKNVTRGNAQNYIQAEAERYADAGWKIEFL